MFTPITAKRVSKQRADTHDNYERAKKKASTTGRSAGFLVLSAIMQSNVEN